MFVNGPAFFLNDSPTIPAPIALESSLWFDASDADNIIYNPTTYAISTWRDKSGNNRHATAAAGWPSGPMYFSNVRFSTGAVNVGRGALSIGGAPLSAGPFQTLFAVVHTSSGAGSLTFLKDALFSSISLSGNTSNPKTFRVELKATNNSVQSAATNQSGAYDAITPNAKNVISMTLNGNFANNLFTANGAVVPSFGPNFTPVSNAFYDGIGYNSSAQWGWEIAEMVYFTRALSTVEAAQMTSYLQSKYAL